MKFSTTKEQRDFFQQNHLIEFENILNEIQIKQLLHEATQVLKSRLETKPRKNVWEVSDNVFISGRDLWRSSPLFKKISFQHQYAEMITELSQQKVIRIGYDQLLPKFQPFLNNGVYFDLLQKNVALENFTCLQGTVGGMMFCLEGESQGQISVFPSKPGNAVFFSPKAFLNFSELLTRPPQVFYLVVYTQNSAVYIHQDQDPLAKNLKHIGYAYGDKLSDKWNPIVYR